MSPRALSIGILTASSLLGAAGSAHAITVSFASDDDSIFPTFDGTSGSAGSFRIRNGRTPNSTPMTLDIDDNNGVQPTASIAVGLVIDLTATYVSSLPFGSEWNHIYNITGSYAFVHPGTGADLLRVQVNPGSSTMSIVGSPTTWGSAGTVFGSDSASGGPNGVNYSDGSALAAYALSLGTNLAPYGISPLGVNEDFAFTMSFLSADGGAVGLDFGHLPTTSWGSEASHSGHAQLGPAPTGAAALGLVGLALRGRRRRK